MFVWLQNSPTAQSRSLHGPLGTIHYFMKVVPKEPCVFLIKKIQNIPSSNLVMKNFTISPGAPYSYSGACGKGVNIIVHTHIDASQCFNHRDKLNWWHSKFSELQIGQHICVQECIYTRDYLGIISLTSIATCHGKYHLLSSTKA